MKKALLLVTALMFGAVGFAQYGPQYVGPAPTASLVPALPGAAAGANTGLSIQNGDDQRVRVRQAGTSQSAYTNQDNGSGTGGNLARVRQTGAVSAASGVANATDVLQSGTENQSTTRQEGDYNSAVSRQGQNDDSSSYNKAKIRQGTGNQAENNIAAIDQDGHYNQAQTQQTYDNSEAWTIQSGDDNKSMVNQNAGPNGTAGHYAYTQQLGDANESSIAQSGEGQSNWAWAYQTGTSNQSKQVQIETDPVGTGYVNYAFVDQGALQEGLITTSMLTDLSGVDNVTGGGANPGSENNVAFQMQNGADLDAETHQGGSYNYSEQNQTGSGNDAFIIQNVFGPAGGSNYARQDQGGTNSNAGLSQIGSDNKAYQRQYGDDNGVLSTQNGEGNILNTYQDGDGNRGVTAQKGEDNTALLVQRGGHSYTIQQNLGGYGGGNQADVLQLGPDGNFATDGIDCEFNDPMDPWMDYTVPGFELDDVCPDC